MRRAIGLFALLTVVMTWPQARVLGTQATPHQDVYFNMWRLEWFAHALATQPSHLFDANIFYPERDTLALSDAMIVEGFVAAPLVWAGTRPVLLHNLLLLSAIALSGTAMFALARYLTGSRAAGIVAGIVFAFAPYRADHAMHMELQWTMWMPLAFLALHRLFDTGQMRYGLAMGACLALQMLSSIYYGVFLGLLLGLAALLLIARDRKAPIRKTIAPIVAGAVIALAVSFVYERPYVRVHERTGDRPITEIDRFSARPVSYLAATPNNWLYGGRPGRTGGPERRLFPGTIALLLAIAGLLLVIPSRRPIVYLLLAVVAFELSLGLDGYGFRFLHDHVSVFRGLRALARVGVFVLMFVAVLSAYGYRVIVAGWSPRKRRAALVIVAGLLLAEYRATPALQPYVTSAPPAYLALAGQPRGVVLELPVALANEVPGDEAQYAYLSTFYWFPLVNGYSGFFPTSYLERLDRLRHFPDETALRQIRADGVKYVIVHAAGYSETELSQISARLRELGMAELGTYPDGVARATLFRSP
jgi:hypothetical protein